MRTNNVLYPRFKLNSFIEKSYIGANFICNHGSWNPANFGEFVYL